MCRSAFVIKYLLIYNIIPNASYTPKECDSRTLKKTAPPQNDKTSPKSTRPIQSETILRSVKAGALGGSSRRVGEVWRGRDASFKRRPSPSKVFLNPPRSFSTLQGFLYPLNTNPILNLRSFSIFLETLSASSTVSVRSEARRVTRSATDFLPAPTCGPR